MCEGVEIKNRKTLFEESAVGENLLYQLQLGNDTQDPFLTFTLLFNRHAWKNMVYEALMEQIVQETPALANGVNKQMALDFTLLLATKEREHDRMKDLLALGADPNAGSNTYAVSAFGFAVQNQDETAFHILQQSGGIPPDSLLVKLTHEEERLSSWVKKVGDSIKHVP